MAHPLAGECDWPKVLGQARGERDLDLQSSRMEESGLQSLTGYSPKSRQILTVLTCSSMPFELRIAAAAAMPRWTTTCDSRIYS